MYCILIKWNHRVHFWRTEAKHPNRHVPPRLEQLLEINLAAPRWHFYHLVHLKFHRYSTVNHNCQDSLSPWLLFGNYQPFFVEIRHTDSLRYLFRSHFKNVNTHLLNFQIAACSVHTLRVPFDPQLSIMPENFCITLFFQALLFGNLFDKM